MPRQSIADLIVHTKTATSLGPVFTESLEQRTENPRVESFAITPINMHPEGSNLIGAFLCLMFWVEVIIPVFFSPNIAGNGWKRMLTLLPFYLCQAQGKLNEYMAYSNLIITHTTYKVVIYQIKLIVIV